MHEVPLNQPPSLHSEKGSTLSSQLPPDEPLPPLQQTARTPYKRPRGVHMVELDVRVDEGDFRPQPEGEKTTLQLGQSPGQVVYLGSTLRPGQRLKLEASLKANRDLFAWSATHMPGIDPSFVCHPLTIKQGAKPVAQRRRKMGTGRTKEVALKVAELLEAGFVCEITYTTWLVNVVLVKKPSGKWQMCIEYTDLNKVCPKSPYPLPNIDHLVDNSSGYQYLSFMDAYSGYNQIPMYPPDQEKTTFIIDQTAYCYTVMPFGLKNAWATYQRMMSKVFARQIGEHIEVYMDDMIAKSLPDEDHISILENIFQQLCKYNMRLNPEKCTFGVKAGKFLGFLLTSRGIEANPSKCQAIIDMRSPRTVKEVQQLKRRLAALSRFLPSAAKHSLPLFQLLKKSKRFEWSDNLPNEVLYVYLAVSDEAVAAVLVRETAEGQNPVYFTSKALQGPELRYQKLENVAYALLIATRRLRQYFQSHSTIVRTNQPIRQILHKPELAGRMITWSIELSQFDIRFEPRTTIKSQVLSDFVAELTAPEGDWEQVWTIFIDGSSNQRGSGAGILLEDGQGVTIEHSITFTFPTSNNQAEYEACIVGLQLEKEVGAHKVLICSDSQLVVSQITGAYQTKDTLLEKYLLKVKELMADFDETTIQHVPRESNARADILSKLANTKCIGNNRSVVQGTVYHPSVMAVEQRSNDSSDVAPSTLWSRDTISAGIHRPLLKCLGPERADYVLREIHEGSCGHHLGATSLAKKVLRARYYWPTVEKDAVDLTRKCTRCQLFADFHKAPPEELTTTQAPWPFCIWGMDILGPFPQATEQLKFLIVAIDYFTKWIEAEALATITSANIQKFTWRNIITRFGIPSAIVILNGTQFADRRNNLDEVEEIWERAHLREEIIKKKTVAKFNSSVVPRQFDEGTLVLRRTYIGQVKGKLGPNWEGPYRITSKIDKWAYKLQDLAGKDIPRTWNAANLQLFYA
ncbi:PREDICTED: uncharacterized protein LOC109361868 [Lupinus angustifolius]|uniref:uncharacterized protein LOC109361868 n=1 Tax=Lupinus angustifolius TaxID=3871 RepID=UPI00092E985F|nr:PREDICTED: uncharacterized protein LOC109361868 [Lupinus angustifolius]